MKTSKVVFLVFLSLLSLCAIGVQPVKSQYFESVFINPDGSIIGTDKIQRDGNVYTLTSDISGEIKVQKSYIVINGAGYTVEGNGTGIGIDLSAYRSYESDIFVNNVTVANLRIENFGNGIRTNGKNNTFYGNYIADCDGEGIWIIGGSGNTIMYNTIENNVNGISICYTGGNNIITKNNMINSRVKSNNVVIVWLSQQPTVDRNYWSDYEGIDEDGDGIGDTPYRFIDTDYAKYMDYHPLMKPVNISDVEIPQIPEVPDTTPPAVSIISPENKTYAVNNVSLTVIVDEQTSWVGYSLDGQANVTIAVNATLVGLTYGFHSLLVYAADLYGNVGASEAIYFSIALPSEPVPTTWIVVAMAIIVVAIATVTVYLVHKRKK